MRLRRSSQAVFAGLDISPGRIKLVGVAHGPEGPVVVCAADEVLGTSAGATTRFDPAAVGAAAAEILSRARVRPERAALALGPGDAVARRLTVVSQERTQMLAALSVQLGQALGAEVAAPRVGFAPLAALSPAAARLTVFAAAARPEAVLAQQRAVAAAGWEQGPVTTTAVALVNAWRSCRPAGAGDGRAVLLHVGESAALWVVLDGEDPVALDAPLVGVASVRDRVVGRAGQGDPADALPAAVLGEWAGRLRQEIARGLQPLRRDGAAAEPGTYEVWVSGGGARMKGFLAALSEALATPVHLFDPLAELGWTGSAAETFGPALAPALGAALQALATDSASMGSLLDIDLQGPLPGRPGAVGRVPLPVLAGRVARDRVYHALAVGAFALWGATAFLGARVDAAGVAAAEREARVTADSLAVAATMSRSQVLEDRRRVLGNKLGAAGGLDRGRHAWPRLLYAIGEALPSAAWVSDVMADGEDPGTGEPGFRVMGYAASAAVAGSFARALAANATVAEAEVVRTEAVKIGRSPAVRFEIAGRAGAAPEVAGREGGAP